MSQFVKYILFLLVDGHLIYGCTFYSLPLPPFLSLPLPLPPFLSLPLLQIHCFDAPLQPQALQDVKSIVQRNTAVGLCDNGLTLEGERERERECVCLLLHIIIKCTHTHCTCTSLHCCKQVAYKMYYTLSSLFWFEVWMVFLAKGSIRTVLSAFPPFQFLLPFTICIVHALIVCLYYNFAVYVCW